MKKQTVVMAVLLLIAFPAISSNLEKEFTVTEGQKLEINLKSGGTVRITGGEDKIVRVQVMYKNGNQRECPVEITQSDEGIQIESDYETFERNDCRSPKLEIRVPRRFDLEIKTMGGEIDLFNIEGEIEGRTMGGDLTLSQLKGEIKMTTMGGEITLKDSDIDGSVKTMGGRVLLENVVGDIKGSSMGGNVVYKNVKSRKGETTGKVVKITTMGGSINVDEAFDGTDVHTMGGEISIKHAKKFAKAKTMGGDIRIDAIDGWAKATTYGGDISVKMTGDPDKGKRDVELLSMGGDITLLVPADLSMNIEIELAYTKESWENFKITSDFKLTVEESREWETDHGSPRKFIYGKGKTKDARNLIKIKTINGNVYLKKNK